MFPKIIFLSFAMALANGSQAAHFQNNSGLTNPQKIETFNTPGVPSGTSAGRLFDGLMLSSNLRVSSQFDGQYGSTGQALVNFFPCCAASSFIDFVNPVGSVGFLFASNMGVSRFTALFHNQVVESFTAQTSFGPSQYFGFTDIQFDRVKIEAGGITRAFVLDNLQTTPIPEPGSYAMLGVGLVALALRQRRNSSQLSKR
jgi:PEP-CTERM motif